MAYTLTTRRKFIQWSIASLGATLGLGSCSTTTTPQATPITPLSVLRIGHQPHGAFPLLKARQTLAQKLEAKGIKIEWTEFPAGPPIMEAMGAGKIDIGQAGEVPPLFAQAKNIPLVYIANERPAPTMMAILVAKDSSIETLADLKGKKITATQASAGHYLLIQALTTANLTLEDVQITYLSPPDGQKAFLNKEVDIWVGWDPFYAQLENKGSARLLKNGEGLSDNTNFYFAHKNFISQRGDLVRLIIEELRQVGIWATENPEAAAKMIASGGKFDEATALKIVKRNLYGAQPIQEQAIESQQRIADTFFRLGLLPQQIRVEEVVWKDKLSN